MSIIKLSQFVLLLCGILAVTIVQAENQTLNKDLDGDGKIDKVLINEEELSLTLQLSSANNRTIQSQFDDGMILLTGTKSGFKVTFNHMRSGYGLQYRYEPKTQKMRLIGIDVYSFGNAANDGSGKASANLLTNRYVGDWHYYDYKKEKLIKLPMIKTKLSLPKTYLGEPQTGTIEKFLAKSEAFHEATLKKHHANW